MGGRGMRLRRQDDIGTHWQAAVCSFLLISARRFARRVTLRPTSTWRLSR